MPLSARKTPATVSNIGLVAILHLHDEIVRIGDFCGCLHLLLCGVIHTKGDIVKDGVVEEDGFLVDVAYDAPQRMEGEVAHVFAVNLDGTCRHVVIARNEVNQRALA